MAITNENGANIIHICINANSNQDVYFYQTGIYRPLGCLASLSELCRVQKIAHQYVVGVYLAKGQNDMG